MAEKALLATDVVVQKGNNILLIKRRNEPYKNSYALPGGFVEVGEEILSAAKRELKEETGLDIEKLNYTSVYSSPGRDPRGRVISFVFYAKIQVSEETKLCANDDAKEVKWFNIDNLPSLAFDHKKIIEDTMRI